MARPREEENMNSDLVRDVQLTPFEMRSLENPSPIDIPPIRESQLDENEQEESHLQRRSITANDNVVEEAQLAQENIMNGIGHEDVEVSKITKRDPAVTQQE